MMNKVIPLTLLASSAFGQNALDYFKSSTWAPAATATGSNTCCTFTANVIIGANDQAASTAGTDTGCAGFVSNGYTNGGAVASLPVTLTGNTGKAATSPASTGYNAAPSSANTGTASWTVDATGQTLTWQPTNVGTGASATCTQQSLSRVNTAVGDLVGTWTPSTGTADSGATCCFLDPSTNVVIGTTGTTTSVTAGKYATTSTAACSALTGGDYRKTLKPAASGVTTYTGIDIGNQDTFAVNSDKTTITHKYVGTAGCTQTLTKVSSSGVHLASIMTPVVVGGAMLGLVVV